MKVNKLQVIINDLKLISSSFFFNLKPFEQKSLTSLYPSIFFLTILIVGTKIIFNQHDTGKRFLSKFKLTLFFSLSCNVKNVKSSRGKKKTY